MLVVLEDLSTLSVGVLVLPPHVRVPGRIGMLQQEVTGFVPTFQGRLTEDLLVLKTVLFVQEVFDWVVVR